MYLKEKLQIEPVSVIDRYESIKNWNMELLKQYVVEKGYYTKEEVDEVHEEYCRYMALGMSVSNKLPICKKVDDFWHAHILFTQDYHKFCKKNAGRYIHHRPAILDRDQDLKKAMVEDTLKTYKDFFGEPGQLWASDPVCNCVNQCENCTQDPPASPD